MAAGLHQLRIMTNAAAPHRISSSRSIFFYLVLVLMMAVIGFAMVVTPQR